jgi:acyl-CoA thioester hydrolase
MEFVYNGKYLEYFEVGRTEFLRHIGLPYSQVEKAGYQLPLIEAHLKYIKPAVYDDLLDIKATVSPPYSAKVHIEYKITHHDTGKLICEGYTSHMFINADTKRPTRPPKIYVEKLESLINSVKQ